MITSLFSKSKPVNFFIVISVLITVYILSNFYQFKFDTSLLKIHLPKLVVLLFYVFLLDFIISKNRLTKKHSYGIMLLPLLVAVFPQTTQSFSLIIANLLVIFAIRRLLSLHTKQNVLKKFFDATFWIILSSLLYSWNLLFLVLVIFALFFYWQNNFRTVGVSLIAIVVVGMLLMCYNIVYYDRFLGTTNFDFSLSFDYSSYNGLSKIIAITIVITIYLWSLFAQLSKLSDRNKKRRPIHILVAIWSLIAFTLVIISPEKTGSEFLFIILPFSIIIANYLERIEETWFREVLVLLLILVPIISILL